MEMKHYSMQVYNLCAGYRLPTNSNGSHCLFLNVYLMFFILSFDLHNIMTRLQICCNKMAVRISNEFSNHLTIFPPSDDDFFTVSLSFHLSKYYFLRLSFFI